MKRKRIVLVVLLIIAISGAALAGDTIEWRLAAGEEAIVYCGGGVLQVEMIDDLTVYLSCYNDSGGRHTLYYPAVGDRP